MFFHIATPVKRLMSIDVWYSWRPEIFRLAIWHKRPASFEPLPKSSVRTLKEIYYDDGDDHKICS